MSEADPRTPSADPIRSSNPDRRVSPAFAIAATIVTLAFLGVGVALGYFYAIARTSGGLGGGLGTVFAVIWVAAIAALLAVAGGVALAREKTRGAGKVLFMAAGAVVVGAISASIAVPALGIRSEPSASTSASLNTTTSGTLGLTLDNEPEFVAGSEGATCSRDVEGGALNGVGAPAAGTLRGRMLSAQLSADFEAGGSLIVFSIQADGVDDLGLPTWTGTLPAPLADGGTAGEVDFADLPIQPQKPGYPPDAAWPRTLSGTLSWTCD